MRQDPARAPHGRGPVQHPDDPRDLRLPAERASYDGEHVDIEDVFLGAVQATFGKLSTRRAARHGDNAIRGPGVCAGMGTANSMHIVCEALGMALPGSAPVLANSPKMIDFARRSADGGSSRWCSRTSSRATSSRPAPFGNAVAAVLSVSGSINCIKHLQATAIEAGLDVDVYELFNELGDRSRC